jgi:hypothetical protein
MAIDLDTVAALRTHAHRLAAYCPRCRRWADVDLADLERAGLGARRIAGLKLRCGSCGGAGERQVRPPAPAFTGVRWAQAEPLR